MYAHAYSIWSTDVRKARASLAHAQPKFSRGSNGLCAKIVGGAGPPRGNSFQLTCSCGHTGWVPRGFSCGFVDPMSNFNLCTYTVRLGMLKWHSNCNWNRRSGVYLSLAFPIWKADHFATLLKKKYLYQASIDTKGPMLGLRCRSL